MLKKKTTTNQPSKNPLLNISKAVRVGKCTWLDQTCCASQLLRQLLLLGLFKEYLAASVFTAETCTTGDGGGFGDPSPQGGSQTGTTTQLKQALLNLF